MGTILLCQGVHLEPPPNDAEPTEKEEYAARYAALCDEIGLTAVRDQFLAQHAERTAPQRATRIKGRPLSEAEVVLWRHILPATTHEADFAEFKEGGIIPLPVLERIAEAKRVKIFDCIEIWHKRERREDPMAVGRIYLPAGRQYYSLGRWGDEDANNTSLKEIGDELRKKLEPYVSMLHEEPPDFEWLGVRAFLIGMLWLFIVGSPCLLPGSMLVGWWNVLAYAASVVTASVIAIAISLYNEYKQGMPTSYLHYIWEKVYPDVKKLWPILDQIPDDEDYGKVA